MKTTLKFKVDVFGADVSIIFTDGAANISKILKKLYIKHNELHEAEDCYGVCFSPDNDIYQYYILFDVNFLTHKLIAHECEHLKNYIFERFNHHIKSGDEELPASLAELIVGKVYDFATKRGIEIHNAI